MTSKGITKQELNNDILQELNKIDKQFAEDTQKDITDIKLKDEEQDRELSRIKTQMAFTNIERRDIDNDGIFRTVNYKDINTGKMVFNSELQQKDSNGKYKKQILWSWRDGHNTRFEFDLIYDQNGNMIERRFVKND